MADMPFEEILTSVSKLDRAELEQLLTVVQDRLSEPDDSEPLTEAEIKTLMTPDPLPPKEVIALGLTGTWAHLGINDGAEWVNEQKRKQWERNKW